MHISVVGTRTFANSIENILTKIGSVTKAKIVAADISDLKELVRHDSIKLKTEIEILLRQFASKDDE